MSYFDRQAEKQLGLSEEEFQAIFNFADVGIAQVAIDGKWLLVNQKLCDIVGYTKEELQSLTFQDITYPEDLEASLECVRQILAHDIQTYSREKRYVCKDGSHVWINLTVSLVHKLNGEPKYFIGVVEDISERKQAEERLRQRNAWFRTLVETTDVLIFIFHDTQIYYVNLVAEAVTGFNKEEMIANSNLYHQFKIKEWEQGHQRRSTPPQYQEIKILTKNGEDLWLNFSVKMFEFEGESAKLVTAIDITQRKQVEVKVQQALEQEKELSELRGQFVYMVSHELRNPLHVISFSSSLLKRYNQQSLDKKQLKYLHRIETSVEHLSKLMDHILLIGRSDAGKLKFEPKMLNLELFCRDLLTQLHDHHTVNFTSVGNCSTAYMDEELLQTILTNLLNNAFKYSPKDSTVDLKISCSNGEAVIEIKDRGIGISEADQKQLFAPFYRGSNVDNISGTGLGLLVVKKLVEIHSGQISVFSEIGVGTTFKITLPLGQPLEVAVSSAMILT